MLFQQISYTYSPSKRDCTYEINYYRINADINRHRISAKLILNRENDFGNLGVMSEAPVAGRVASLIAIHQGAQLRKVEPVKKEPELDFKSELNQILANRAGGNSFKTQWGFRRSLSTPQLAHPTPTRRTMTCPTAGASPSQEVPTDNSSGSRKFFQTNQVSVDQLDVSKYDEDSYSINGKKVCLVLVISKFDNSQHNRKNTENDHRQASEVLKRRGFEVILLVDHVTKKDFSKKLKEIRKRTDIGLFMLVVSSHGDENDNVMFSDNSNWDNGNPRCKIS